MGAVIEFPRVVLLSLDEALTFLEQNCGRKMSRQTMYNRLNENTGPRVERKGGRLRFRPEDLVAWDKADTEIRKAFQ